jgi:murein DD-endopeptidase MepM/ murein hydrolase activator NlpD
LRFQALNPGKGLPTSHWGNGTLRFSRGRIPPILRAALCGDPERSMRALTCLLVGAISLLSCGAASAEAIVSRKPASSEGMDTWLPKNGNSQRDTGLRVGTLTGVEDISFVRFDLSGLPLSANKAYLWLYANGYSGTTFTPMTVTRVGSPWQVNKLTSANQPGSYAWLSAAAPTAIGWYRVDVTSLYPSWRSGGYLNFGLRFASTIATNNHFNLFSSSGATVSNAPQLDVYYTPQANDKIIKLKWPLGTAYLSRSVTQAFGTDWAGDTSCNGLIKKHNGTDFHASPGTAVSAAEDGFIKEVLPPTSAGWASNIVIEHNHPVTGKFTTVYWHVNPSPDIVAANPGGFVPKGLQIASVADLSPWKHASHFHFGVRIGSYASGVSGTGALPQTNCGGYPAFPAAFIDANNATNVIFQ